LNEVSRPSLSDELRDALYVLGQYLSDKVAPLMALDALTLLMEQPLVLMAEEIGTWCARQAEVQHGLSFPDLLFHAARKIHIMGDFSLIPADELEAYLRALGPLLVQVCPEAGREQLVQGLSRLNDSRQALASQVEIVHRQAGARDAKAMAASASAEVVAAAPPILSAVVKGLGRLPLLLQRLERLATPAMIAGRTGALTAPGALAPGLASMPVALAPGRAALVADALLEASLHARNGSELEAQLVRIRQLGAMAGTEEMFRALGGSVPGWVLPAGGGAAEAEGAQVGAMRRMIALADEPAEAGRRFREMVHSAIEQFNAGAYGRSLKMFELARQMVAAGEVKATFVEPMLLSGHEYLSEERVRKLAERPESHLFLRPVLAFFRAFAPGRLLDELQAELRRDRRRQLLNLIEAHGAPSRAEAWLRLQQDPHGRVVGIYFLRNLVHLLKAIPRPADAAEPVEEELDAVARLALPGCPLLLVKEALQYLVGSHQPRAEARLVEALAAVEEALLDRTASAEDRAALVIQLDRTAAALARFGTPRAWSALVEHALSRRAPHGDTLARLSELGSQDLAAAPQVVARLVSAIEAELPRGVFGRMVAGREATLGRLVNALSATRTPAVRELLADLAEAYSGQGFGRDARKAVALLDQPKPDTSSIPSISGDLDLFGLPTLLQNLAELRKSGTLNLLDTHGRPVGTVRIEGAALRAAQCGARQGREAVYQLIERPFPATFAFVSGKRVGEEPGEELPVAPTLFEAIRRHDALQRALALVPEDASLEATGDSPSSVPDEPDYELVVALWQKACAGTPPREMEDGLAADSYRVFRALAHWVEEGALRARAAG